MLGVLTACLSPKNTVEKKSDLSEYPERRNLIILYEKKTDKQFIEEAIEAYRAEIIYRYDQLKGFAVRIPDDRSINAGIAYFKKVKGVKQVSQGKRYQLDGGVTRTVKP